MESRLNGTVEMPDSMPAFIHLFSELKRLIIGALAS